jgi:hypothetical protein
LNIYHVISHGHTRGPRGYLGRGRGPAKRYVPRVETRLIYT